MKTIKPSVKGKATSRRTTRLADVVGCLRYRGKAKTIEEMHAAVAAEARKRK